MALSDTHEVPGSLTKPASAPRQRPLDRLNDSSTIRVRCSAILDAMARGVSANFALDRNALAALADRVAALTLRRFPDLHIPFHSRWRHFEAGGVDRKGEMDTLMEGLGTMEQARSRFDLTVLSVLLDGGAGGQWSYTESGTKQALGRSEGLAVASFRAFLAGTFSATHGQALRVDATALQRTDAAQLRAVFQSSPSNPIVGLEGRAALLVKLGEVLQQEAMRNGLQARPGLLFDRLVIDAATGQMRSEVAAADILAELLRTLAPIWPSGSVIKGVAVGDVWPHRWAGNRLGDGSLDTVGAGWVPFHKLSQWLSYSLLEPLQWAGVKVTGLDALTGLPEYRNGGLLLDGGVIKPRDPRLLLRNWTPQDEFIIEWRAATIALLDELAVLVRQRLGKTAEELPLACILEGGTWAAGRELALELRPDGSPPLKIESDGTIF